VLQREFEFLANPVVGAVDPSATELIAGGQPLRADDGDNDIAHGELAPDFFRPALAYPDLDVAKDRHATGTKALHGALDLQGDQRRPEQVRVSAVVDECLHVHRPLEE
jgi:hypothetical protein